MTDQEQGQLSLSDIARFWAMVNRGEVDECWEWTGSRRKFGYGQILWNGRPGRKAHRVSWEIAYGAIPCDMEIRHSCDNPPCVNPKHLLLGSHADNMKDMKERGRSNAGRAMSTGANTYWGARTACHAGHLYTDENTYITPNRIRVCRTCRDARVREWKAAHRNPAARRRPIEYSDDLVAIVQLHAERGLSMRAIGKLLGLSHPKISRIIHRNDIFKRVADLEAK